MHLNCEQRTVNNWKIFCQTKWKIEQTETVTKESKEENCMLLDVVR